MSLQAFLDAITIELILAAFAGGAFGAALGALPAFIFTGFMVIAGEVAAYTGVDEAANVTGLIAFGPIFGPHVAFAGGAAATAYAARQGYMDTGFDYHEGKNILYALGTKPDILAVGGLFGVLGMGFRQFSAAFLMPWDPIAMGVTISALFHRLILGFPLIGDAREGLFNMRPFENEQRRAADGGTAETNRLLVEPWLPHQYKWANVTMLGLVVGIVGAYTAIVTGSPFLGFGISAATLVFLNAGVEQIPVTHHITLPASTAALAVMATGSDLAAPNALLAGVGEPTAVVVGAVFGIVGALLGEVWQRIFYAHGDTHWDPPAASIAISTFFIALMVVAGIFPTTVWVPYPF